MIGLEVIGAKAVAAGLDLAGKTVPPRAERLVGAYGHRLATQIRGNASGRPGPNVVTGDYRRSWTVELGQRGGGPAALVGTNAPQARRLEFGFVGADSLGRNYNQAPLPHVDPAVRVIEPQFIAAMEREVGRGL